MTAPLELTIRCVGTPARQGSKDWRGMRRGRPVMVESDPDLPQWRQDVVNAARSAMRAAAWLPLNGPCEVWITVWLPRPATVKREYPDSKMDGDGDKYVRAIFDALTIAGVWADDSRAVDHHARKRYAKTGQPTGARIRVAAMSSQLVIV